MWFLGHPVVLKINVIFFSALKKVTFSGQMCVTCARDRLEELARRIIGATLVDNRCLGTRLATIILLAFYQSRSLANVTHIWPLNVDLFETLKYIQFFGMYNR